MLFDATTAKLVMRDRVSLTLRLNRPACRVSQLIPLGVPDGQLGRLRVIGVWRTLVGAGDQWRIRKLGFDTAREFRAWWLEAHDADWWARGDLSEGAQFERFNTRWRDRACWAVAFEVARDVPFLLAPCGQPPRRSESRMGVDTPEDHGYVSSPVLALPDEPEAVDPAEVEHMAAGALQGQVARFATRWEERRGRPLDERLRLAELDATALRADVSSRLRVIERQVEAIERITMRGAA